MATNLFSTDSFPTISEIEAWDKEIQAELDILLGTSQSSEVSTLPEQKLDLATQPLLVGSEEYADIANSTSNKWDIATDELGANFYSSLGVISAKFGLDDEAKSFRETATQYRKDAASKPKPDISMSITEEGGKIYDKFSGSSNAGKFILAFNDSQETAADIQPIHLPDAHAQYQFMSDEATQKIMLGHGIVSPILLGIKDNTGFGNNAEELRTAAVLMDNVIIKPLQDGLLDGFEEILSFNKINLDLYFVTIQPIEFTQLENISTSIKREEETGEKTEDADKSTKEEGK